MIIEPLQWWVHKVHDEQYEFLVLKEVEPGIWEGTLCDLKTGVLYPEVRYCQEALLSYWNPKSPSLNTPEARKPTGIRCPICGAEDVIQLFSSVECYKFGCQNYKEPK